MRLIICSCVALLNIASLAVGAENIATEKFDAQVWPILRQCIGCHGPDAPAAELDLTKSAAAIAAGAIVPGDAASSMLIERVTADDLDYRMPPEGTALSNQQVNILRRWIDQGAPWPRHWAYRPLTRPSVPKPTRPNDTGSMQNRWGQNRWGHWARNSIDRFVAARLTEAGLQPSPPADRRTLLRRIFYDLIGLPPTPADYRAFLADDRPDAYLRVVDRLLSSPAYGERWARHWMDLVHFAETHGHDQDRPREHAWPYRDYLIRRCNEDVPYQQFVEEQIAGDVLYPADPWAVAGTGFLAAGPWDESSLRDIQEDSIDREIGRYLDRDDIVMTVMSTFTSTSVHCARCHHHKFDPISQDEYYGLQAVFAGIDKANRAVDMDPAIARERRRLIDQREQTDAWLRDGDPHLLSSDLQTAAAAWEASLDAGRRIWKPVEIVQLSSDHGATLTQQTDQSVLSHGDRPDKDTYTILARTNLPRVRGLKLEVLADERLPMHGPGRQDNGNLHLNEIRVFAGQQEADQELQLVSITRALADFNQTDWDINKAIDGDANTAWGIHPRVGKSHYALFELAEFERSTDQQTIRLRVELDQVHGQSHLIGRFRIAVTDAEQALNLAPVVPQQIARILAKKREQRSDSDRMTLAAYVRGLQLETKLAKLPPQQMVYCGTSQFQPDGSFRPAKQPRTIHVLSRGDIAQPLHEASPTALSCIEEHPVDPGRFRTDSEARRRAALADWLSSSENGLVWRSIANRLWQYHFSQPLVDTPNDFGFAGSMPTHPHLLNWLASELQALDGSFKGIHRLIVTSSTYRQASRFDQQAARVDKANRLLWRMNRERLDAEAYRDSLLVISGTLNNRMGGPSDRQFNQSKGVHVTPVVDYQNFNVDDPANYRRSVYRFIFRTLPDPFMKALDCPDASQLTPQRSESLTPVQTLATMNDKFVVRQSELIADRIASRCARPAAQVDAAFRCIFAREPTSGQRDGFVRYVRRHGLANACRLLVNTNEFLFVD